MLGVPGAAHGAHPAAGERSAEDLPRSGRRGLRHDFEPAACSTPPFATRSVHERHVAGTRPPGAAGARPPRVAPVGIPDRQGLRGNPIARPGASGSIGERFEEHVRCQTPQSEVHARQNSLRALSGGEEFLARTPVTARCTCSRSARGSPSCPPRSMPLSMSGSSGRTRRPMERRKGGAIGSTVAVRGKDRTISSSRWPIGRVADGDVESGLWVRCRGAHPGASGVARSTHDPHDNVRQASGHG